MIDCKKSLFTIHISFIQLVEENRECYVFERFMFITYIQWILYQVVQGSVQGPYQVGLINLLKIFLK